MNKQLAKIVEELKKDKENAGLTDSELLEMAQFELDAKENCKNYVVGESKQTTKRKVAPKKVSDAKKELFNDIFQFLDKTYESVTVLNPNKLIQVEFDGKVYKVDLIETRAKK